MKELLNFIPATASACRALLQDLRKGKKSITLVDRFGNKEVLDAEESAELARMISLQIGETVISDIPEIPEESAEVKEEAPAPVKKPAVKKSAKK